MTTSRLAASLFLRANRLPTPMAPRRLRIPGKVIYGSAPGAVTQSRFYSQEAGRSKNYSFADVKNAIDKPDPNRIIIDVREPGELQSTGRIPTAVNIPISSQPDSFFITAEEFEDRYGFDRPGTDKEVVFYCKAGVRSRAAAELARQAGWNNVGEYPGSWLDWEKNGGETQRGS